jgi:hemoglobin
VLTFEASIRLQACKVRISNAGKSAIPDTRGVAVDGNNLMWERAPCRGGSGSPAAVRTSWKSKPCPVLTPAATIKRVQDVDLFAAVGEEGFERLVSAFYRRVPGDDILGPMYPENNLADAEQRLRDFLIGRFGGPQRYIEQRGHPRLRLRHLPFAITPAARDRWVHLMEQALEEASLPPDAAATLREFFGEVATMMINRDQ